MKNVYIYNIVDDKKRYPNELLLNYLRAQVDNSIRLGWDIKDIIIGTNFDFEYRGVKNVTLKTICTHNVFYNKFYGMLELMDSGVLDTDFWFHDQDCWQIHPFEFPQFEGEIGGCTYVFTNEWNTASLLVKKSAADVMEYIVDFMELNKILKVDSDENVISFLRANSEIREYLTDINQQFNVGYTQMEKRLEAATKPVYAYGFKPHIEKDFDRFNEIDLIPNEMIDIFRNNNILHTQQ